MGAIPDGHIILTMGAIPDGQKIARLGRLGRRLCRLIFNLPPGKPVEFIHCGGHYRNVAFVPDVSMSYTERDASIGKLSHRIVELKLYSGHTRSRIYKISAAYIVDLGVVLYNTPKVNYRLSYLATGGAYSV